MVRYVCWNSKIDLILDLCYVSTLFIVYDFITDSNSGERKIK